MQMLLPFRRIFFSLTCSPFASLWAINILRSTKDKAKLTILLHPQEPYLHAIVRAYPAVYVILGLLTDIVVESEKGAAELCKKAVSTRPSDAQCINRVTDLCHPS